MRSTARPSGFSVLPDCEYVFIAPRRRTRSIVIPPDAGYGSSAVGLGVRNRTLATLPCGLSNHEELSERDRARWRAARDGDPHVRQELVEMAISAVAMRLSRFSGHDLDEIRQMIAAALLKAFELGIEPASSLEGFLQWRARGQISRFVRQRVRDGRMPSTEAADWAHDGESPLQRATESELLEAVMACIAKVPSKEQRESFAQRVVEGREPRDIAAERGVEARRVRVWIARAAILVRECLSRSWNQEDRK